jgi:2-amino-4-hydroxy-6-hydroxymethyldihydropteridine diphosphokinase
MHHNLIMVIYLGLGANVGDREEQLRQAVRFLVHRGVLVTRTASLYLTEPRDFLDQPWFLNTVAEANTTLEPRALLDTCLNIERDAGRVRTILKGPRSLDIDILFYGAEVIDTSELAVPHPRYAERRFVLVPLVELHPDFEDPVRKLPMKRLLEVCPDPGSVQVYGPPLK